MSRTTVRRPKIETTDITETKAALRNSEHQLSKTRSELANIMDALTDTIDTISDVMSYADDQTRRAHDAEAEAAHSKQELDKALSQQGKKAEGEDVRTGKSV